MGNYTCFFNKISKYVKMYSIFIEKIYYSIYLTSWRTILKKIKKNYLTIFLLSTLIVSPVISHAEITNYKPSNNATQVHAIPGFLKTDKGNPVEVYQIPQNQPGIPSNSTNNHGWTFLDGQYWINGDQVAIILRDEFKEIKFSELKDKDVLVRYENNKIIYSLTACTNCEKFPQPDLFLFNMSNHKKPNHLEKYKIYRKINPNT
jgi:hypothetical protein